MASLRFGRAPLCAILKYATWHLAKLLAEGRGEQLTESETLALKPPLVFLPYNIRLNKLYNRPGVTVV